VHEIKHDGFRFICRRDGDRVRVFSRNGRDWTDRVPLIAEAIAKLRVKSVTIDGEGVVCRQDGVSDFDRLRAAVGRLGSRDAFLYAFDVLEINGTDLRRDGWDERRKVLARLLGGAGKGIRLSEHISTATALSLSHTPAAWVWKASCLSIATGPIDQDDRRIGSRSNSALRVYSSTYAVKGSHLAPLATNAYFGKCQNRAPGPGPQLVGQSLTAESANHGRMDHAPALAQDRSQAPPATALADAATA
jgi:hypothetical protein